MRKIRLGGMVLLLAATLCLQTAMAGQKYCVSLGWQESESGQNMARGYEDAFRDFGIPAGDVVVANANHNAKLQSEQIEAFIKMNPAAIFVTAADPAGITGAVKRAVDAGVPVFMGDSSVAGAAATTSIFSNNYGIGAWAMRYICERLGGKGKVGMVNLPKNETWDLRTHGAKAVLREYPDIELVVEWAYDSSGNVTPRQGIENMLTANPKGSLDAIWCAWDDAATEGAHAIVDAGRQDEIFTTGIDGGEYAFSMLEANPVFALCMAQSSYYMAYESVRYAVDFLQGKAVPRWVISPTFAVTAELLENTEGDASTYGEPGKPKELGWTVTL